MSRSSLVEKELSGLRNLSANIAEGYIVVGVVVVVVAML